MTSAVDLEAEWLRSSGDGCPALLKADGGPWDVVQAYWPRTPLTRQSGVYVMRGQLEEERFANQRKIQHYAFRLRLVWPIGGTTVGVALWEDEQRAFDAAIDDLVARIRGTLMDHMHGGRFLSVAEAPAPPRIAVQFDDPSHSATSNTSGPVLGATATYSADSRDFTA